MERIYLNKERSEKERAEDLLSRMDLEEKMGQIVCFWPKAIDDTERLEQYPQGAGVVSATYMRILETLEECTAFQKKWQNVMMEKSKHHIPAIFHMEGLCGPTVQGAASFPDGLCRAASWDPELEMEIGRIVGRQESALGIGHVFAPVLDLNRDPRNGRMGETYGEDPVLASSLGVAYIKGIQSEHGTGIRPEAVAKHFAGFHASIGGIQFAAAEFGESLLKEIYLKPFQAAISKADLRGVMPCYDPVNGIPVSASKKMLQHFLRKEMGFDGLAVSDYDAILNAFQYCRLYENLAEAGARCLEAGIDVEEPYLEAYGSRLKERFERGELPVEILDRAVERILEAKFRMGLFEHPYGMEGAALAGKFYQASDAACSKKSAQEGMVLLKNQDALPLAKGIRKMAVIGVHAITGRFLFGGYTHYSMAEGNLAMKHEKLASEAGEECEVIPGTVIEKSESSDYEELLHHQKPDCKNLLEALKTEFPETEINWACGYQFAGTDNSLYEEAYQLMEDADVVILTLGGKHGTRKIASMGEGIDAVNINLPACQENFLKGIKKRGKKLIGIHYDGRPVSSDAADEVLDAILEAWSPAEAGNKAVAEILSGRENPSGKLPVTVAYHAGQIPLFYNMPNGSGFTQGGSIGYEEYVDLTHKPRYPFGFGLSYTDYEYKNLAVLEKDDQAEICFQICNTGNLEGVEIVQLYIQDCRASMVRPVMELAGFQRIALAPGEEKAVTFRLFHDQMAFVDENGKWKVEKGEFHIYIGASSADMRLKGSFTVKGTRFIEGRDRHFYAEALCHKI